jgi:predicted acetyltransferase
MGEVRKLEVGELADFVKGAAKAYPGTGLLKPDVHTSMLEKMTRDQEDIEEISAQGYFRDGVMLGGQVYYDLQMNVHSTNLLVGGVGFVWVDFLHKKERIAKELITSILRDYRERGAAMTALFPFRPDFYKNMGFGFGMKMHQYRIRPDKFPKGPSKANIHYITKDDQEAIAACYRRYATDTHGMTERRNDEWERMFKNPEVIVVGYKKEDQILGYMAMAFTKPEADAHFIRNDMTIAELIYETPEALSELMTFIHSQADQINQVVITTMDETFHHLFADPSNGSNKLLPSVFHVSDLSAVGLMYRIIDVKKLFESLENHDFGDQTCRVKLSVRDTFLPENAGSTVIHFVEGRPQVENDGGYDVEVSLNVEDLSSLVMGTVDFKSLYRYGLVSLSDLSYLKMLQKVFLAENKPICLARF